LTVSVPGFSGSRIAILKSIKSGDSTAEVFEHAGDIYLKLNDNNDEVSEFISLKDVEKITSNNELIGNIHLLHMNKTDIHNPSKYFVKLYLFNFNDA
jgi:hypothetical protein